jgi:3-phosphoshikimate 1-carboxyvinyltransferase
MRRFRFEGKIPVSKSLFIRQAICQSFTENELTSAMDACADIRSVENGLRSLKDRRVINAGDAATVLRFLALRASREAGDFVITGSERLMQRPHDELKNIFESVGVKCELGPEKITISGEGWKNLNEVKVDRSCSSQFASGVLLNSWNLPFPLRISWGPETVSDGYWEMSLAVARNMGMNFVSGGDSVEIPARQIPNGVAVFEPDMSSAFAVAALAAPNGMARILDFPTESLQPDAAFIDVLNAMGLSLKIKNNYLEVMGCEVLLPIDFNLRNTPDMFPVLAALCAFANGKSRLWGAPHLVHKESNRLEKTFELLESINRKFEPLLDGVVIHGRPFDPEKDNRFSIAFDPEADHRLVMAACVARQFGFNMRISRPEVVDKSFPQFKEIVSL